MQVSNSWPQPEQYRGSKPLVFVYNFHPRFPCGPYVGPKERVLPDKIDFDKWVYQLEKRTTLLDLETAYDFSQRFCYLNSYTCPPFQKAIRPIPEIVQRAFEITKFYLYSEDVSQECKQPLLKVLPNLISTETLTLEQFQEVNQIIQSYSHSPAVFVDLILHMIKLEDLKPYFKEILRHSLLTTLTTQFDQKQLRIEIIRRIQDTTPNGLHQSMGNLIMLIASCSKESIEVRQEAIKSLCRLFWKPTSDIHLRKWLLEELDKAFILDAPLFYELIIHELFIPLQACESLESIEQELISKICGYFISQTFALLPQVHESLAKQMPKYAYSKEKPPLGTMLLISNMISLVDIPDMDQSVRHILLAHLLSWQSHPHVSTQIAESFSKLRQDHFLANVEVFEAYEKEADYLGYLKSI